MNHVRFTYEFLSWSNLRSQALASLVDVSTGDLRKAINLLQSAQRMHPQGGDITHLDIVEVACVRPLRLPALPRPAPPCSVYVSNLELILSSRVYNECNLPSLFSGCATHGRGVSVGGMPSQFFRGPSGNARRASIRILHSAVD